MLLFKTYTLELGFDRHPEHMVSYQSELPVFVVGEFGIFEIFIQNHCFAKPDFSYFSKRKRQKYILIWIEYNHILPFANHKSTPLRFILFYL